MFDDSNSRVSLAGRFASACIALALIAAVFYFSFHQIAYHWNWTSIAQYRWSFFKGWTMTLWISAASLVLSTLIGLAFALIRRSHILPLRYFGNIYVELVRGTPLLVQILIF